MINNGNLTSHEANSIAEHLEDRHDITDVTIVGIAEGEIYVRADYDAQGMTGDLVITDAGERWNQLESDTE